MYTRKIHLQRVCIWYLYESILCYYSMKSWKAFSSIGCNSYKFVPTMNINATNTIVVFKSTLVWFGNHNSSALYHLTFDTNITLISYLKANSWVNWISILYMPTCCFQHILYTLPRYQLLARTMMTPISEKGLIRHLENQWRWY